jgi:GntR family transcriptional regulator, rspAB operon transcriptional repressor
MPADEPRDDASRARPATARDTVLDTIRRRIIRLELPPGAALSEQDLAAQLGVSRTPVRESLILLREEGLVRVYPQYGSFVTRIDPERIARAQFVREAIECAALAEAVDAGPHRLDALRDNLAAQGDAVAHDDRDRFFELDEAFHRLLLDLSGHGAAWPIVTGSKAHLDRVRRVTLDDVTPPAVLRDQHAAIVHALETGGRDAALTALRSHLRIVFDDIGRVRERHPELFVDDEEKPRRRPAVR